MPKKAKHEKEPNLERWLVSYADFITLLFAVFVVLYAMSQTDKQKVEEVAKSVREAFGMVETSSTPAMNTIESTDIAAVPTAEQRFNQEFVEQKNNSSNPYATSKEFEQIKKEIAGILSLTGNRDKVKLVVNKRGLIISVKEAGFFSSGSAAIQAKANPLLEEIGKSIMKYSNDVRIEGHTDNVPIISGTFRSNWELSTARSASILHYFIDNVHFPPQRLSAVGYGEFRPIADNSTESGRAKNRRVDIVLLSKEAQQGEPLRGARMEE